MKEKSEKWYTVPNFISIYELTNDDHYYLFEGYCTSILDEKSSGKYYNKILIDGNYHAYLQWIGYDKWWEDYMIERSWFKRLLFGSWKRKKKSA